MAPFRPWKLERDINRSVKTLFQHVPGMADVNTWFVRGCPSSARRTRTTKAAAFVRSLVTKDWYGSDLQAEREVIRAWDAGFRSVFAVFPAIDELGHRHGPLCEQSDEAYRRLDRAFGRLVDQLTRRKLLDRTLIVLTSDHGQSTTNTHFELDAFVGRTYRRTLSYPEIWRYLMSADAAVMVSGNAMANVYLAGVHGWQDAVDVERDARATELVHRLLGERAIDHVIYRAGDEFVVERAGGGRARIALSGASQDRVRYRPEGQDPFDYGPLPAEMSKDEIAVLTADTDYPDAPWQITQFFRSRRAGDLIVCARPGYDLRARFEYQPHRGSHGGLHREHMLIPAGITAKWPPGAIRSVDLFPTILSALEIPVPSSEIDGVPIAVQA
jgi:arylsulfatase A-like enzyme